VIQTYDVAVIGSGAGGAPLAALLAEAGRSVILIEAGGPVKPEEAQDALKHYYMEQGLTAGLGSSLLPIPVGEAIGGTTVVNSGTCIKPSAELLQSWDKICGGHFEQELSPFVETVWKDLEVSVPPAELLGPSHHLFAEGLKIMGKPAPQILPRNAPGCQGSGVCCFGCPTGAKKSTDQVYVSRATQADTPIFSKTRVHKIGEEKDGVLLTCHNLLGVKKIRCRKLIIAAGSFGTTRLIRRNRLGTQWKKAGHELSIHPASKVVAEFPDAVHGERGIPQGMGLRLPELPSVMFEGIFTPPSVLVPVIAAAGASVSYWLERHDNLASFAFLIRDRGRGSIRWINDIPLIRYSVDTADAVDIAKACKLIAQVYFKVGAVRVLLPFTQTKNEFKNEEDLESFEPHAIRPDQVIGSGFHPLGTAGLGRVVDAHLRLPGTKRIYVCDGSILPGPPGINPQVTIMGFSHWLADQMQRG
jgi:choline dehydrogenase-like flavoprotein